jgi:hypothetical protein
MAETLGLIGFLILWIKQLLALTLRDLPDAKDVPSNVYQQQNDPSCLRDTRRFDLQKIRDWAEVKDSPLLWIKGMPGHGKSMMMQTAGLGGIGSALHLTAVE